MTVTHIALPSVCETDQACDLSVSVYSKHRMLTILRGCAPKLLSASRSPSGARAAAAAAASAPPLLLRAAAPAAAAPSRRRMSAVAPGASGPAPSGAGDQAAAAAGASTTAAPDASSAIDFLLLLQKLKARPDLSLLSLRIEHTPDAVW
jgi:hypothetical protein